MLAADPVAVRQVFEVNVVGVSGDQSQSWCEESVCVLAHFPFVLVWISLVDMVCGLDLSASDFEVDELQTLAVSKRARQCYIVTRAAQESERKHGHNASPVDVGAQEDASQSSSCMCKDWSSTSARRKVTARKSDVSWSTVGPPLVVEETPQSDHTFHSNRESYCEFDANHTWTLGERVENLWKFLCLYGRLSLNSLASS